MSITPKLTCRFAYDNCQNDARLKKKWQSILKLIWTVTQIVVKEI